MSGELPNGWATVPIGELSKPTRPRRNPQEHPRLPFVGMEQVESHTRRLLGTLSSSEMKSTAFHFQPGDVLYGKLRPYLNKVLCAAIEGLCSSEFIVLPPQSTFEPKYLAFYLSTDGFVTFANQLNQGDRPRVRFDQIADHEIPLPPLLEQRRIVAKLETLLGKVDASQQRLAKIPVLLKRFRQAVLAAACSGRLTADWREENPDAEPYAVGAESDVEADEEFPLKWMATRLGALTTIVTSGSRGWAKYYADSGSTFIRAQNINSDFLNLDDIAFVRPPLSAEGLRTKVQQHDILITITGANVTKSALVENPIEDAYVSQHVALVRLRDVHLAKFLFHCVVSPANGRKQLQVAAYGQGKPGLNLENIRDVVVGLPPLPEQQEIVRRVEGLFALADQLELRLAKARWQVDKLTPSLLTRAFAGKLVPQDPNDEPAERLLKRIHAQSESKSHWDARK